MRTENVELMRQARESLSGHWGLAVGTFFIYMILVSSPNIVPLAGLLVTLIITGPMAVGAATFSLNLARDREARIEQLFSGFNNFGTAMGAYFMVLVIVLAMMLLLIVPGIIAAIAYSQVYFIISDDDSISASEALKKSKEMMNGYKAKYFRLMLRFMGWSILCLFTLGIGYLWLIPYMQVTLAKFHDDVRGDVSERDFL